MLVIKEAVNSGRNDNLLNRVAFVLSQSDQIREWKQSMPETEYKAKASEYILNKFDTASALRESVLGFRKEQEIEEEER